jgi:hypothetical protein
VLDGRLKAKQAREKQELARSALAVAKPEVSKVP